MIRQPTLLRPRALAAGNRVAVVAPSSRYDAEKLRRGAGVLKDWGLEVELPAESATKRYLAASDDVRAAEPTSAFARDDVDAVIAVRGGYGFARLLGKFDPAVAAAHPKIFLGYSDLTVALSVLVGEAGLLCFHGPMVASDLARLEGEKLERFRRFLFGEDGWWAGRGLECIAPGRASGRLAGGCLSVLLTTIGTPYEVDLAGKVLFLEDINEPPYRIDRLLTQLAHTTKLDDVAAVVLGHFDNCNDKQSPNDLREIFVEILGSRGIPVVAGFDAGHHSGGAVVPMGCKVHVDAGAGTVELAEPVFASARDTLPPPVKRTAPRAVPAMLRPAAK